MFKELFNTSWLIDVIVIIAIVAIIISLIKFPNARWFIGSVVSIVLIATAIFSLIEINSFYKTKGGIYGQLTGYFNKNQVVVSDMTFDFKDIMLTENGIKDGNGINIGYNAKFLSDKVFDMSVDKTYELFINNVPVKIKDSASDYVLAEYEYVFLDKNKVELFVGTLSLEFAFYEQQTTFNVSTTDGSEGVKFWNDYFNKNSFVVKIQEVGV